MADIRPMPFLSADHLPLKNWHRGVFRNGHGLFYCGPVGKGRLVAQRIREKTLCPSESGSSPVFNDGVVNFDCRERLKRER
jgi:hypothetical protein